MVQVVTQAGLVQYIQKGVVRIFWEGVGTLATGGGTGAWVDGADFPDKTIQAKGVFEGGTLFIEGTNDTSLPSGRTPFTLSVHGADGIGDLSFTTTGGARIVEQPFAIRPFLTSGTSTEQDVDVTIIARGNLR